jgi:hypothetical protein
MYSNRIRPSIKRVQAHAYTARSRHLLAPERRHAAVNVLQGGAFQRGVSANALALAISEASRRCQFPTVRSQQEISLAASLPAGLKALPAGGATH